MKLLFSTLSISLAGQFASAASILIDDFSQSSFMLGSGNRQISSLGISLDDRLFRRLRATGHSRWDWSATQEKSPQSLTFQIDIGSTGFRGDDLVLRYSTGSQEGISMLGSSAVVIDADILQGSFVWHIQVNTSDDNPRDFAQPIVSGTDTEFSFSDILGNPDFRDVLWLQVYILPLEQQSEIRVNSIRLIPEPSSSLLLLFGIPMIWRRRKDFVG